MEKSFYFVRHRQTDHNLLDGIDKEDHPENISLNDIGKKQAEFIEPFIASLPIQTICSSPLRLVS